MLGRITFTHAGNTNKHSKMHANQNKSVTTTNINSNNKDQKFYFRKPLQQPHMKTEGRYLLQQHKHDLKKKTAK